MRAIYYTTIVEDQEYSSIRPLVDWLDYNGYRVVAKPGREFTDASGRRRVRGSIDVELTVDAMELAPCLDGMVLVSGDGDFRALVEAVQRRGVRVTVVSTVASGTTVADELRRQADEFVDLAGLVSRVGREPRSVPDGRSASEVRPEPSPALENRYGIRQGAPSDIREGSRTLA